MRLTSCKAIASQESLMKKLTIALAAASLLLASSAFAAPPTKTGTTAKGAVLTDAKGMTLYTFD